MLAILEDVFKEITGVDWKTIVVAVVTDASGESLKARKMFSRKHPQIIVLDCYSHQVSNCHALI